jgi:hypothetical protein
VLADRSLTRKIGLTPPKPTAVVGSLTGIDASSLPCLGLMIRIWATADP